MDQYKKAKGEGTSLITLLIPANYQLSKARKMVTNEYSTASNIKSRVNRLSVMRGLRSIEHLLVAMKETPVTGIALMSGQWV